MMKPNPYVEVIVDGKPGRRTSTAKSTYQPDWATDPPITLLVTPYSKILLRLFDHSSFKKDALLGEHTLDLFTVLKKHDGRLNNVKMSVDVKNASKTSTDPASIGELVLVLDGFSVDDVASLASPGGASVPARPAPKPPSNPPKPPELNGTSPKLPPLLQPNNKSNSEAKNKTRTSSQGAYQST